MNNRKNKKKYSSTLQKESVTVVNESVENKDNDGLVALKEEILRWIFSILGAILVYLVVAKIVLVAYHPDINELLAVANKALAEAGHARPEPIEAMLFRIGVIVFPIGLLFFYAIFSRIKIIRQYAESTFFLVISGICIVLIPAIIYFDFSALNPFGQGSGEMMQNSRDAVGKTNFDFYFDGIFLGNYFLLYAIILIPLISCLFFFGIKKYHWEKSKMYDSLVSGIGYLIAGALLIAIIAMNTFIFPYTFENKYDFNAVYFSMTQVYAGAPMLVDGFTNTYGLYPQLLNPLFQIIGLNIFNFSMVMSILIATAFTFNFYILKRFVNNKIILFLGFLTVLCFPYLNFRFLTNFDSVFSSYPIRYIIPSTTIFLATIYLFRRSRILYWATFIAVGSLILWNPEIGMVSYISWLAMNTYIDYYDADKKPAIKKILFHWLAGIIIAVTVLYSYKFIIYFIYGRSPDLVLLFNTILVFGKISFDLLPMALLHPWNISVLILILGFIYSISKWYKKEITHRSSIVLLISMIGVGYFFYFQGRSHNWPFAISSSFCIILLILLGDDLWTLIRKQNLFILNALFVIFLFIVSFSSFEIISNTDRIKELVYQDEDKSKQTDEQRRIESNIDFVKKNSKEHEKIYVFTARQYEGLYFDGTRRIGAFHPGFMDLFLNTDVLRLQKRIIDSSFSIFLEPSFCIYSFMNGPLAAVGATYEVNGINQSMAMLKKRKTAIPSKSFFETGGQVLFHRKYTDDTGSIRSRINDALGAKPIDLNTPFSVAVLFNSSSQVYPFATLVGNMNDSSGFIIAKIINSPNYFFGINGKGVSVPLPANQWVYCVMNVYPDHLEIYKDGELAGTFPVPQMRRSPEKLFVGNIGYFRNYIGAIAEVAVNGNVLSKDDVEKIWAVIKPEISK